MNNDVKRGQNLEAEAEARATRSRPRPISGGQGQGQIKLWKKYQLRTNNDCRKINK